MRKRVVMFSGGIASWATAKLVAEKHGTEGLFLVFADVKGNADSPHIGEDEDTYTFIKAAIANVGGAYVYLNEGRDIWTLFKDQKFLGNSRVANCSKLLKQRPARKWLEANCNPNETTVYVGIDWSEIHRLPAIVKNYKPYEVESPLAKPPYRDKDDLLAWAKAEGLPIPRLYKMGFAHNNCGGGCVRAGQGQFKKLLETMPDRFEVWMQKEQEVIEVVGRQVSILTEVVGGVKKPLPLIELKRRAEEQPQLIDDYDIGSCGCFFQEDESDDATEPN